MTTLSKQHHVILQSLRDVRLAFHEEERKALEVLLAITHDKVDGIDAVVYKSRLTVIERGIENTINLILNGPDASTNARPKLTEDQMILCVHLQWMLDVIAGTSLESFATTLMKILVERLGLVASTSTEEYREKLEAVTCTDPHCRAHRQWWNVS